MLAAAEHREIRVDRDLCMGSAQCSWYAPNTFDQDADGVAIVTDQHGDPEDAVRTAVQSCPTRALSIATTDAEAGTIGND